ncbi:hemin-degrading factor [Rhodocista pekingensis]|uniref:Hemin-degrading factor n=1 Tax=Rhodocista pekingensis TaxID=201185 RepID=A0ABW2KYF2_9PROT
MDQILTGSLPDLKAAWLRLLETTPGLRARDAAARLGVSEGELVAARVGEGPGAARVVRLDPGTAANGWGGLIEQLPTLGEVMTLTRNEHAVHEKHGTFETVSIGPGSGLVLGLEIDLRLFLNHWRHGFAVREEVKSGLRDSLQFFDIDGTAVHKVYVTAATDRAAFDRLVERFRAPDQTPGMGVLPLPVPPPDRPDAEIDLAGFRRHWENLQDAHDFFPMLREFGIGRHQAFRLIGSDFARPVSVQALALCLRLAAQRQVPIMVFAGNAGCIQIHTGPVERIEPTGPWINVLDPRFNLHVRQDRIASAWVVRKPTREGVVTSLELFDAEDRQFLQLFGERRGGKPERATWRGILADLPEPEIAA